MSLSSCAVQIISAIVLLTMIMIMITLTRGSAMAERPRDALVSKNSAIMVQNVPFEN